jgi:uncharacterized protein
MDLRTACRAADGGTRLRLRVAPRAKRTGIAGLHAEHVKVRLAAPPVDGKANDLLLSWLADALSVPGTDLRLCRGHRSRDKEVAIAGLSPDEVSRRLAAHI